MTRFQRVLLLRLALPLVLFSAGAAWAQPYTVEYTYDVQGRLTRAALSTTYSISYTYDAAGNLLAAETGAPVSIEGVGESGDLPSHFALHDSYPNPFNPTATISFDVKEPARVRLVVHDVLGRRVATLVDEERAPGRYRATFDARGLASGLYLYRIDMGAFRDVKTMLLVK